jgi:predicted SnoaL-like aldol condensation-catalyzing enzyme
MDGMDASGGMLENAAVVGVVDKPGEQGLLLLLERFNQMLNAHDVDAMMALMDDGCVFENTYPPPDGSRIEGKMAVAAFWRRFFEEAPAAHIEIEELFAAGERGVQRWRYTWGDHGHVRGVDLFRVAGGKIVEKLSYVKG